VMDVDFSPTGREFVSGSYDRTVRIWRYNEGKSREVYYGKRMQRVFSVAFSGDANFVLSGSDDFSIRLWKANASEVENQKRHCYWRCICPRASTPVLPGEA
jgi:WD repeat and SOF domain-containing protein 1